VKDQTFHSPSLARDVHYRILLPAGYADDSTARFPVLYLLHGLYGDRTNWSELTKLAEYARPYKFIIVMPDGANSWYVNSYASPHDRYEDFIFRDLIAEVDSRHRTLPQRQARAIAGLSMGGFGTLKFALKYPDSFVFAASMTGALNAPLDLADEVAEFRDELLKAFGPPGNSNRAQNDVFFLASEAVPTRVPYLYMDCGTSDGFLFTNRQFAALLQKKIIPFEYHEFPGGHEWQYWDARLPAVLHLASRHFSSHRI
jgi:putative tributyrin esterase